MAQTYHNVVTLTGGEKIDRVRATAMAMLAPDAQWDWVEAHLEGRDDKKPGGHDDTVTRWDFYSRDRPSWSVAVISGMFAKLTFTCLLMDISGDMAHHVTIVNGQIGKVSEEPIEWDGEKH